MEADVGVNAHFLLKLERRAWYLRELTNTYDNPGLGSNGLDIEESKLEIREPSKWGRRRGSRTHGHFAVWIPGERNARLQLGNESHNQFIRGGLRRHATASHPISHWLLWSRGRDLLRILPVLIRRSEQRRVVKDKCAGDGEVGFCSHCLVRAGTLLFRAVLHECVGHRCES